MRRAWRVRDRRSLEARNSRPDRNWLILRPPLLLDGPGTGIVSLGPAEFHGEITRDDVAATLAELSVLPSAAQAVAHVQVQDLTLGHFRRSKA
ncbi:NAD(P)H-binding protein [Streptomyces canus]|uniref:NAD(P)H-binding protein n=1 Tax=Streptomyces canus TaxID=58343 RepID=UPI00380A41BD